jgi:hypothetical protein
MKILREERGNVLVLTMLSMTMLLTFMAFAIDIGNLFYTQRQLQTLADAAAMAGALEVTACGGTSSSSSCTVMKTAATTALTEGGGPAPTLFLQCAPASGTGLLLTINNGPCALGANDPNHTNTNYVEAVVTEQIPAYFARFIGLKTLQASARAEAGIGTPSAGANGPGIYVGGLTVNGGNSITDGAGNAGIYDNGSLTLNNGSTTDPTVINVGSFNVQGSQTVNNCPGSTCTLSTPPTKGSTMQDPFKNLVAPSQPATSDTNTGTISGNTTLHPGTYASGINFNSGTYTVTLNPGLYYINGGFNINSNVTITGTGVTLYMTGGSNINSAATWNLTAPSSALSNCASCAGMAVWQASGSLNLDSSTSSTFNGSIYVPNGTLTLNSGANAGSYGMIDASSLMLNSGTSLVLNCTLMPSGYCPGGTGGGSNGAATISLAE